MKKETWNGWIGTEKIEVIECLDSGSERVWIKFEPVDKTKPMEVCNLVDKPGQVSWKYKNSHFETIDGKNKGNYYAVSYAGSLQVGAGITTFQKDAGSKIIIFPLDKGGSIDVNSYSLTGSQFEIKVDKPTWIAYAVSGSGSINPV